MLIAELVIPQMFTAYAEDLGYLKNGLHHYQYFCEVCDQAFSSAWGKIPGSMSQFGALIMIEKLQRQIKETPIEVTAAQVIEKIPEEVERELNELRAKAAQPIDTTAIRFKIQFDTLVKGFGDLLRVLEEIDTESQSKYKNAVSGLLSKMSERL